jgi:hypothetical protein
MHYRYQSDLSLQHHFHPPADGLQPRPFPKDTPAVYKGKEQEYINAIIRITQSPRLRIIDDLRMEYKLSVGQASKLWSQQEKVRIRETIQLKTGSLWSYPVPGKDFLCYSCCFWLRCANYCGNCATKINAVAWNLYVCSTMNSSLSRWGTLIRPR